MAGWGVHCYEAAANSADVGILFVVLGWTWAKSLIVDGYPLRLRVL